MIIESTTNPKFKYVKGLQKSRTRKKEGRFVLEGRPELDHAIEKKLNCEMILFTSYYISKGELIQLLMPYGDVQPAIFEIKRSLFDELTYQNVPGNFLGVFETFVQPIEALDIQAHVILLEGIEKPGNLGAIIRTCDALGIHQIICTESSIDNFNPNVLRNARGASFEVNVFYMSNEDALDYFQANNYQTLAAAIRPDAVAFSDFEASNNKRALILGSESKGLGPFWIEQADHLVIIPMKGVVDSLNVSVSGAILASHLLH